jgi:hypothetical protein
LNTNSRIPAVQLSRTQLDSQTILSEYKAGYGIFIVTSKFAGTQKLNDLFFDVILKTQEKSGREQHDF